MTDAWDPSIPEHKEIAHGIELGDGIAEMRTIADARKALKSVGFNIIHEEDLADREWESRGGAGRSSSCCGFGSMVHRDRPRR
jgi:hypothetical protein